MAVLTGSLAIGPSGGTLNPYLVPSLSEYALEGASQAIMPSPQTGTLVSNLPVSVTQITLDSAVSGGYGVDFFQYFKLDPESLDVGFVAATVTHRIKLWNRNPFPVTLTGVTAAAAQGIDISLPVGTVFAAYQERIFTVTATTEGPGVIAALYTLDFDGTLVYLPVTGVRARVWPFGPDWSKNYVANYAYKTEMFVSRSGREQRRALRHNPRFSSEFDVILARGNLAVFEALMSGWQNKPFVMPDWTRYTGLVSHTVDTLTVDGVPAWMTEGASVIIGGKSLHTIISLTGTTATVRPNIETTWAFGTQVFNGYAGLVTPTVTVDTPTNTVGQAKIRFDAMPAMSTPEAPPAAPQTFNGRELWMKMGNWSTAPQVDFEWPIEKLDYDRGRNLYYQIIDFSKRSVKMSYLARNRDEVQEFKDFFDRMMGMRGEFYAPTWKPDLVLIENAGFVDVTLKVEGAHAYDYMRDSTVYKHILIVLNDGTQLKRTVSGITLDGENSVLTITSSVSFISPVDVLMICWIPAWTLSSDILTITWITDSVAQIGLTMRTVEDLNV